MKSITFGPVTHKDKSYAYSLGYGAYQMGHSREFCPYHGIEYAQKRIDFNKGYMDSRAATDKALSDFIQERK